MPDTIPFCDLSRAISPIRGEIDAAIKRTIDRSWFLRGPETAAFEEEWAQYCGQRYAVACNSGTDALTIAAIALGLGTAAVPANTLPLTAIGLHKGGANVRVCDVGPDGHLADVPGDAVPVLLYGRPPDASEMRAQLFDAAHAHGWKPPSEAAAAWSFYPTKSLGALGDGGAVTTNDPHVAAAMRKLTGLDDNLRDARQITSRMDDLQAAVLRVKLKHLDDWLAERQDIARRYEARLGTFGIAMSGPSLQHLFVIRVAGRDDLSRFLEGRGIACKVHWPTALHRLAGCWSHDGSFANADDWCNSVLSLPCFPGLRPREIERICDVIVEWLGTVQARHLE